MNNFIIISKTFVEFTPESAIDGDFSNKGFIEQDVKVSFTELVQLMKDHAEASCSPDDMTNTHTWYSTYFYTSDYTNGIERQESIHFGVGNTPNAAKWWFLARKFALKM